MNGLIFNVAKYLTTGYLIGQLTTIEVESSDDIGYLEHAS
jgi:hypothetical protein